MRLRPPSVEAHSVPSLSRCSRHDPRPNPWPRCADDERPPSRAPRRSRRGIRATVRRQPDRRAWRRPDARPQARPRNPLDDSLIDDVRQRRVLADPDVARGISGECLHTAGKPVDRAEAAVLEHDDAAVCRHPDPLPVVLEERLDQVVRQPCVGHHAPGWSGKILRERSSLLR